MLVLLCGTLTLTASSFPSWLRARWTCENYCLPSFPYQAAFWVGSPPEITCAREADAIGSSSNSAKRAEGGAPSSSVMVLTTSLKGLTGQSSSMERRMVATYSSGKRWS